MITRDHILMGREKKAPLTKEMEKNLNLLIVAINALISAYKKPVKVSSGYRPAQINSSVGGASNSAHMTCEAVDLVDTNRDIAVFCLDNLELLESLGLYMEDPRWTPTWVHLQIRKPKSGKLVFIPNNQPPLDQKFKHKNLAKV